MTVPLNAKQLVDRLWSYCHVLRHDGVSTIDYVDQLTLLLFLKMADERAHRRMGAERIVPEGLDWQALLRARGDALETQYNHILRELGKQGGTLGRIFQKSQNKIRNAATLRKLIVDLIDKHDWSRTGTDIKGDAYEALLERGGRGRQVGGRPVLHPAPADRRDGRLRATASRRHDHGSGRRDGRLPARRARLHPEAVRQLADQGVAPAPGQRRHHRRGARRRYGAARADEPVAARHRRASGTERIEVRDALAEVPIGRATLVLANPPFGRKSGFTSVDDPGRVTRDDNAYARTDFWKATTNKQLNFVQHIFTLLETDGRAAVVLPDNVLFEGGAGEEVRRRRLKQCDVHTMLRLPTGIFYAGGVKANVLFFDKKQGREKPWTEQLWVYDFRVGQHFTLRQRPLTRDHLQDFVDAYRPGEPRAARQESERFRPYTYDEILARDKANLDLSWLRDPALEGSDDLLPPEVIAQEIVQDLQAALVEFAAVADALQAAKSGTASP